MKKFLDLWQFYVGIVVVVGFLYTIKGDVRVLRAEVAGSLKVLAIEMKNVKGRVTVLEKTN